MCVNRSPGANSVTGLLGGFSNPRPVTVWTLDSVTYCCVYSLSLPDFLISAISTTQVHPPTWESPVSVPSSTTATQGHLPTWASLVSIPAYQLPTQTSSPFWLRSYYIPISPPLFLLLLASWESSRVDRSCFSVASCCHHAFLLCPLLCALSPLHTPQMRDVAPPTVPQLSIVALCKSYLTGFPLPRVCILPPVSHMSHLLIDLLYSTWSFAGTPWESFLSYFPFTPKGPTFPTHTIESPEPPPCRNFPTPWYLPLPSK